MRGMGRGSLGRAGESRHENLVPYIAKADRARPVDAVVVIAVHRFPDVSADFVQGVTLRVNAEPTALAEYLPSSSSLLTSKIIFIPDICRLGLMTLLRHLIAHKSLTLGFATKHPKLKQVRVKSGKVSVDDD